MYGWFLFFCNAIAFLCILYLPGMLLAGAIRSKIDLLQIAIAPALSFALFSVTGLALSIAGFSIDSLFFFIINLAICLCLFVISQFFSRQFNNSISKQDLAFIALYVFVASVLTFLFFVKNMDSALGFDQAHDNVTHLNLIHYFMVSGDYTQFANIYTLLPNGVASCTGIIGSGAFYPSGWHILAAVAGGLTSKSSAIAETSSFVALMSVCFPMCILAFMRTLYSDDDSVVRLGSLFTLAFSAFPWKLVTCNGPLFPYVISCFFVPALASALITWLASFGSAKSDTPIAFLMCLGILGVAFVHPSAVFTFGVFICPFIASYLYCAASKYPDKKRNCIMCFFCLGVAVIWVFMYKLPFMQGTVGFWWSSEGTLFQAFVNCFDFSFSSGGMAQLLIPPLFIVGILYSFRENRNRWLCASFIIGAIIIVITKGTDWPLKSVLSGFWYTDGNRVAAICVLASMPLTVLGCHRILSFLCDRIERCYCFEYWSAGTITTFLLLIASIMIYAPNYDIYGHFDITTAFGNTSAAQVDKYTLSAPNFYSGEEQDFVNEVKKVVNSEDVILNNPEDGSFFANSVSDLNVYYRTTHVGEKNNDTRDSQLVRTKLNQVSVNSEVRQAVQKTNAKYVLILGQGGRRNKDHPYYLYYKEKLWRGINRIRDDTPGFTVVLSKGDNRLYRIDDIY